MCFYMKEDGVLYLEMMQTKSQDSMSLGRWLNKPPWMVKNEPLINAVRSKSYSFKKSTPRMQVYKIKRLHSSRDDKAKQGTRP